MLIMGLETSCDETGIAVYDSDEGLISNVLHSQVDLHARFGGVVPELASRDHIRKITVLTRQALKQADRTLTDLDAIAYTTGPGLLGALLVGATFARSLSYGLNIPAVAVHHMEAHLLAPLIETSTSPLPFIALLVSGGHTQLVEVRDFGHYQIIGESLDDAAGEAFDKAAKMLGLGYPGGPRLAACAENGDPDRFHFPRPMTDRPGLDFSFSGLKTFTRNTIASHTPLTETDQADIARAFEDAVVDTLFIKCRRAVKQSGIHTLILAGGVSANRRLRARLEADLDADVHYAAADLCTDNGAMIAYAGWRRFQLGDRAPLAITPKARWPISDLNLP